MQNASPSFDGTCIVIPSEILLKFSGALTEAVVRRCSSKWVLLKISQYSQENTCAGVSF